VDFLRFREVRLFEKLTQSIQTLTKQGKSQYQIFFYEISDNIQDLALAYGERRTLEECIEVLSQIKDAGTKKVLETIFRVFGVDILKRDQGFYMAEGALSVKQGRNLPNMLNYLVKELAKVATDVIESLNVPVHALYAPIAGDYIKYNATPNYGEVVNAKL
jgi:acyl-CoA oxidase